MPEFSGPWADELESAYRNATSDFERDALADGAVSDAEFREMEQRFRTCMNTRGVGFSGFKPGGGYEFHAGKGMSNKEANGIADECSETTGVNTVGMIYNLMLKNPQNLDADEIMAECLAKRKMVPQGYSASDYKRDSASMSFPFTDKDAGAKALDACTVDPLGLLGLEP